MSSTRRALLMTSLAVFGLCGSALAQDKTGHTTSAKLIGPSAGKSQTDAKKKGAGTGGYSQAAADRWRATQALGATHKGTGTEAGEIHKTSKTGLVGVSGTQRKGWVYTGHVRRPHTDAK